MSATALIKAVLDTNILVSAMLKAEGREALIFELGRRRRFVPVVSGDLVSEYEGVLGRPGFGFDERRVGDALRDFLAAADWVRGDGIKAQAAYDPADHMVLDCAIAGGADYLVTGNLRHFPAAIQGVRTIRPRDFLVVLAAEVG